MRAHCFVQSEQTVEPEKEDSVFFTSKISKTWHIYPYRAQCLIENCTSTRGGHGRSSLVIVRCLIYWGIPFIRWQWCVRRCDERRTEGIWKRSGTTAAEQSPQGTATISQWCLGVKGTVFVNQAVDWMIDWLILLIIGGFLVGSSIDRLIDWLTTLFLFIFLIFSRAFCVGFPVLLFSSTCISFFWHSMVREGLEEVSDIFQGTKPAIWRAAGSLLNVVDAVLDRKALNGFAVIRPPGHHAHHDAPAGFCFANNVAIAAKYAVEKRGLKR